MQYLIVAYDYEDALERRLKSRQEHLKEAKKLMTKGNIIQAGALIEDDKMVGSTLIVEFNSDEEFDKWLGNEIYVRNRVWNMEEIQIVQLKILPKD